MRCWTQLLPVFFFKWYARRYCERMKVHDSLYAVATDDVLVLIKEEDDEIERLRIRVAALETERDKL